MVPFQFLHSKKNGQLIVEKAQSKLVAERVELGAAIYNATEAHFALIEKKAGCKK